MGHQHQHPRLSSNITHERALTFSRTYPAQLSPSISAVSPVHQPTNAMFPPSVNMPLPKSMHALELAKYANAAIVGSVSPNSQNNDDPYKDVVEIVYDQNEKEMVDLNNNDEGTETIEHVSAVCDNFGGKKSSVDEQSSYKEIVATIDTKGG